MSVRNLYPQQRPTLNLNFAQSKILDPRITFTRTSSATYVDEDGFIKTADNDVARFDHDPVTGECLGLLIEEQRANRCTQSSNFSFSGTSNITETNVLNPDGTAAIRRVPLSTGTFHGTSSNAAGIDITDQAVGGTTDVTTSIFVRNYNNSNLRLLIGFAAFDATPTYRYFLTTIDTANPTTLGIPSGVGWSNGSTKVENYGNGWYRYTLSGRYNKVAGFNTISFVGEQIFSSTGQQFWNGDDVSGIYTWGKQIELGLFSTSYIPTAGSTVTRTADNASITGSNFTEWYNQSEGTVYCALKTLTDTPDQYSNAWELQKSDNTDRLFVRYPNYVGWECQGQTDLYLTRAFSQNAKMATAYKTNDTTFAVNSSYAQDISVTIGETKDELWFGSSGSGNYLNGTISQLTYYPVRLTNAQLQTLTK